MNLNFKKAEDIFTLIDSYDVKLTGRFSNLTKNIIYTPDVNHKQSAVYAHEIDNVLIYEGRSLVKDGSFYIDTPLEWSYEKNLEYIMRVKAVHKSEFSYISDDFEYQEKRPLLRLSDEVFHCGSVEHWNFGFFLTVLMPKIYYITTLNKNKPILVPIRKSWQVHLLQEFFCDVEFVFYDPDIPVHCDKVISVSWPEFGFYVNQDYIAFVRGKVRKYNLNNGEREGKIFLGRSVTREIDNRVRLGNSTKHLLRKKGYNVIYPELLTYQNLFSILHGASDIIVESGSALFNLIFSNIPNITVLESRSEFVGNHYRFISSVGENSKMIYFDKESEDYILDYLS